ncbi:MAG: hypothetical protein ACHQK9_25220 [Reyranellales bacterium]
MQFPDNNTFLFKRASDELHLRPYEKMLGEGIRSFISELYMVDGGVLLGYICGRQHENLGDLIRSSTELVIKPGRLRYGNDAFLEFDWGRDPQITIAMEFLGGPVTAHFRITFARHTVGIEILGLCFAGGIGALEENLCRLAETLEDAQLRPLGKSSGPHGAH